MEYTTRTFKLPTAIPGLSADLIATHLELYAGYVKHVNVLTQQLATLKQSDVDFAYAIAELRRRFGFEWNGMRLHEYYFETLEPGPRNLLATSPLYAALTEQYGGYTEWLAIFSKLSARGPGWAILTYDARAKRFFHVWVADHEVGHLASLPTLLAVDHWEHAYLPDYKPADKMTYVHAYLNAINWDTVSERFDRAQNV